MGFATLAYSSRTDTGGTLQVARPNPGDEQWRTVSKVYQICGEVMHLGGMVGGGSEQYYYSTDDHLYFLWDGNPYPDDAVIIDTAPQRGWIGRGLSGWLFEYELAYTAYDPLSGQTSLRAAYRDWPVWHTLQGPASDFAPWTYLEQLEIVDGRPTKISMLYYDIGQGALKRASWPPEPDIFLPLIG